MRLCPWAGALAPVLVLLTILLNFAVSEEQTHERHYYIAAVEINWNYSGNDTNSPTYKKVVFREYERGFTQAKAHPAWLGLLGPTLRAEEGETIVVTFRNMATEPHSIHPHGIAYGKQSEGAYYFDNTSQKEKADDVVRPNEEHVYYWEVTREVSPEPSDPSCLTHSYFSHRNMVTDINAGLIGALLICKRGSLGTLGEQANVPQELVLLFGVFDEKQSVHKPTGDAPDNHVKYTINGYTKGSLPDVRMCAHSTVSLHLLGVSSEPELFSIHFNGHVLQHMGHKLSAVGLISGSSTTATIQPVNAGRWMLSSQNLKHIEVGMHGFVEVKKCNGFIAPLRRMTIAQRRESREWKFYIAAEEVVWDYAPNMPENIDEDYKMQYLRQSSTRIGQKYKKAVYTLYKNESFTERLENKQRKSEQGIIGPVIRAQIRDVIKIVFKNLASRPYSIYPQGLTIDKSDEGYNYPEGGNQSHAVQPGETYTYVWRVLEEDQPLPDDARCLTRLYHSAVDPPRDIASGLIGPLLICKSQSLNVRNVQVRSDKEQHAMFTVFDENKSWYLDDNIRQYCGRSRVNKADPDFYKSNVMHSINGYVYESGTKLGFCYGEVATWHMSSIGAQDYIQTATVYGHPFGLNGRMEDILSLYPMTGESITMDMMNKGIWLLASLTTHETTKGMRIKMNDVECYRDRMYEYNDYSDNGEFHVWQPTTLTEFEAQEEKAKKQEKAKENNVVVDDYTAMFANELGLRSLKNQSGDTEVEMLDLSMFDYGTVDETGESTDQIPGANVSSVQTSNSQNGTQVTEVHNTTVDLNSSQVRVENTTIYNPEGLNVTADASLNRTTSEVLSDLYDSKSSEMESKTSITANVPKLTSNLTLAVNVTQPGNLSSPPDVERLNATRAEDGGEKSEEKITRGDVFAYSAPQSHSSTDNCTSENKTGSTPCDAHPATNHSLSSATDDNVNVSISSIDKQNTTQVNSSEILDATSATPVSGNVSTNITALDSSSNSESSENLSSLLDDTPSEKNKYDINPRDSLEESTSQELTLSGSSEEILIYLQESDTEVIKTTGLNTQQNWSYNATHEKVPMEISDYMTKYTRTPPKPKRPKKIKRVHLRHRPQKGHGMKTRRRKVYKPEVRRGMPFSPRGFNPMMTPRGSRPMGPQPVSDEEELINMPVVIGVPRPDFSSYELYVPGDDPAHVAQEGNNLSDDEYEYVGYKDPYSSHEDIQNLNIDEENRYYLKHSGPNVKTYFIAAEEVEWDYSGYGQRRQDKSEINSRETKFTKVVFRGYVDGLFRIPDIRGELDEHLGILGPVLKAEVGQSIMVVFKNNAKRPFSLHPTGVTYAKWSEGLSYEDESYHWYRYDNEVPPGANVTYVWKASAAAGPKPGESDCRTWAYHSGVNPERDINSGLIGPLLVCRPGTLQKNAVDMREFTLLFMTFDESQSWYYEHNRELIMRKRRRKVLDPDFKENLKFCSINGIIYNLKGLRMYTYQLARWHIFNMGSPRDFQSIHFHGQTFLHKQTNSYRQAVHPLLPGSFATLEMYPPKPGLWQLESEIASNQYKGMQTLFLVLDNDCYHPLGMESGAVADEQITAINTRGYWEPHLARLNNYGKYNAWSTEQNHSWIQVDFQRPVVISQVATQGAKQLLSHQFVQKYSISYSNDRRKWTIYKGDSKHLKKVFPGNQEAYQTKRNILFPPLVGRFIRIHPIDWYNMATLRLEFYGCQLDGCSIPLGMERGLIENHRITASSVATSWYSGPWKASLARLNRQGTINAWQAKFQDMNQWLQVELSEVKKITGIITQGAKSLGKEMYVISYSLQYSDDGLHWTDYTDDEGERCKVFKGNTDNNEHVKNYIYPPIFSRFIRIKPKRWIGSITMRVELLGCDYE